MSERRYRGNRNGVTLGKYEMKKGELIPTEVIDGIPSGRFGSLVRTGLIIEVNNPDELAALPEGELGERCPICNEGPYKRVEQHITLKHPDPIEDEEPSSGISVGGAGSATGTLTVE